MTLKTLHKLNIFLFLVFCAAFGFPMLGVFTVDFIASQFNCTLYAAKPEECTIYGIDFGPRFYSYMLPMWGFPLTFLAFIAGFWDVLIIWIMLLILSRKYSKHKKY